MKAINHALTGAIIGVSVHQPAIALPVAFLSHYVLDAVPHYGGDKDQLAGLMFKVELVIDALLCAGLVAVLGFTGQPHWQLLSICAFLAASPDLLWINQYRYALQGRHKQWKPNLYSRFAVRIQWFEKPIGAAVEVAWFVGAIWVLTALLN